MGYKGIIFDLDGVICSTDEYHYQAWKAVADLRHIPFDRKVNNRLRGVSRAESLEIILERYSGEMESSEKEGMMSKKNAIYRDLLADMSPADLNPAVKQTLDALRERGFLLAIGSSSKNARYILERIGLYGYFDAVSDGTDISRSKPDPQVFLIAAERLGLHPKDCLVVEDAAAGLEAAHRGGMDCAAIGDAAKTGISEYVLGSFTDLLETAAMPS